MGSQIIVVEDDASIADAVSERLRSEGMAVRQHATGSAGLADHLPVDLVVLDLGLPDLDGFEVCRQLRARSNVPILMLTARDDEADKVLGLTLGADDYLAKPFGMRELVARVHALLRRSRTGTDGPMVIGALEIDRDRRAVRRDDRDVTLTATEFDLLVALAQRPGSVRTRQQLQGDVWGFSDGAGLRTIDSHVRSLRRKLGAEWIRTAHGVGYALETAR